MCILNVLALNPESTETSRSWKNVPTSCIKVEIMVEDDEFIVLTLVRPAAANPTACTV
jgi:hypothetical protein